MKVVLPAIASYLSADPASMIHCGVSERIRPSRPMMVRVGSCNSRHHATSVRSPKVQHMAMPAPLSISAAEWANTGTSTPYSGVVTVVPKRC